MNAKEELTKLLMESYDRGVKDAKQEALAALEKVVAVTNNTCEKHCEATAFKITIRGLEHEVVKLKAERNPLSDEEALEIARTFGAQPWPPGSCVAFARAIEAKHGVKENKHDATTE